MRKLAREAAFKLIYEYLFIKEAESEQYKAVFSGEEFDDNDKEYIKRTVNGVIENFNFLTDLIEKLDLNFKLDRIYKSDLAIILLSAYEQKFMDDIPKLVSINEAIEISKIYGTEKSPAFVNGVLAGVNAMQSIAVKSEE